LRILKEIILKEMSISIIDFTFFTSSRCIDSESRLIVIITTNRDIVLVLTLNVESPLATIELKPL